MNRKVALALSGGGARGMAHIGVIRELMARGYDIHAISGCSIGSVVGAMFAMGKLREFTDFILEDGAHAFFSQLDFTLSDQGFIKGEKLLDRLQEFAPDCNIEDLSVKLTIVATDMNTGEDVVYESGSVYRAIRASVAIPAVLTAVHENNRWLVDGGVVNPLPLPQVHRMDGDMLFAVNLYASPIFSAEAPVAWPEEDEEQEGVLSQIKERIEDLKSWKTNLVQTVFDDSTQKKGYFTTLRLMSELACKRLAELSIQQMPVDVLVNIPIASCGLFSFDKASPLITLGRTKACVALDAFEEKQRRQREKKATKRSGWLRFFSKQ